MLASYFVVDGVDSVRNPTAKVEAAGDTHEAIAERLSAIPDDDPEMLVRTTGALQVLAGMALATNRLTRSSALVLATTMAPSLGENQFWEMEKGAERSSAMRSFLKDLGLLGGLLIVTMDTGGKPGVAWRTGFAARRANELADHKREILALRTELALEKARAATAGTRGRVAATGRQARRDAKAARKVSQKAGRAVSTAGRGAKKAVQAVIPG